MGAAGQKSLATVDDRSRLDIIVNFKLEAFITLARKYLILYNI